MPSITGFHHVALSVRDADASERFYADVFGFVRVLELPDEGGRGYKRVMMHPDGAAFLGFSVHQAGDGSEFSEFTTGLDHLAFGVSSRAELDAWIAHLEKLGIEHSTVTTTPVGELLTIRDPDNIQIELWLPTV